jgi:nickel-type superoxide dismutase maturation protease
MSQRFLSRPVTTVVVSGESMLPTYAAGDWLVATKAGRVEPGQVVVIERESRPGILLIKRVIRTEAEGWWVEGDNASASDDSRTFGAVSAAEIVGRIRFRYRRA